MTSSSKAVRYLIGGLLIGAMWYVNRGRPAWEEALRTIAVFTVVMALMKGKLKRRSVDVHLVPLVASKAVLVTVAAVVEVQVQGSIGNASLVVAIGLALAVTLLGPLGDGHYFTRTAPPAPVGSARQVR
jgi:peptidoglycan/LPS O-acetylase OafA/YrhL